MTEEQRIRMYGLLDKQRWLDGFVADILCSNKIPKSEKQSLCKAVDDWLFRNGTFTRRQRGILFRIRNEHHISNSSLYSECEPETWLDKLLW